MQKNLHLSDPESQTKLSRYMHPPQWWASLPRCNGTQCDPLFAAKPPGR